jgi:hypothetical protein
VFQVKGTACAKAWRPKGAQHVSLTVRAVCNAGTWEETRLKNKQGWLIQGLIAKLLIVELIPRIIKIELQRK